MGPEVPIILFIGVIGPLVFAALVVSWWLTSLKRDRVESAWAVYAARRGMAFVPAAGEWPNRTAPLVHWSEGRAQYRIEARGAEDFVLTGVVARPSVAVFGKLTVRPPGPRSARVALTGDPLIDTRFEVLAQPRELAPQVLTVAVTRALLGFDFGSRGSLSYERGDVKLWWAGGEENGARLDEARGVVRQVVQALDALHGPQGARE